MTYDTEVLADSPAVYWEHDEASGTTMTDTSGNGRNGTYTAPTLAQTSLLSSDASTAVALTGSTSQGQIAYASWMNSGSITIEAWVQKTGSTAGVIMARDAQSGTRVFQVQINASGLVVFTTLGAGVPTVTSVTAVNDGNPHHVVCVFDDGGAVANMYIYIDGALDNSHNAGANNLNTPTSTPLTVGNTNRTSTAPLGGVIQKSAYYTTALSAARALVHYTVGSSAPPNVPTSVSSPAQTTTSIDLAWSAPSGGGPVTSYEVRIDGGSASTATSPHTFTTLTPATPYTLEVRAVGPGGNSSWVSVAQSTSGGGPDVAYAAYIRIGNHFWDIEFDDAADLDSPEVLAGASFNWTAPDDVGWPPPMWTVPRDVCQLRVRSPDASDVEDVRRGDVVRFKFTPLGYDYDAPLVDFAGIITGEPAMTNDRSGGVILTVTASDYRVLLSNFSVPGETIFPTDTAEDSLGLLSAAIDTLNTGEFPGAFGDVTVGAVDPRGWLAGTLDDVIVPTDGVATAMALFTQMGFIPAPQYDEDGDLDLTQPFRIIEPDPYGADYDTPTPITAALIPNSSWTWRRDFVPDVVEYATLAGYLWMGGVTGDIEHATRLRVSSLAGFNSAGFSNMIPETDPWAPYVFTFLGSEDPEAVRDWFIYPERVRQYVTIEDIELVKNPAGTDTVSGMLKGATLVIEGRGRWTVQAGLRPHHFDDTA